MNIHEGASSAPTQYNGIWIPIELWETPDLTPMQRILLAEVNSLDTGTGCFAGNEFLAKRLGKSVRTTQRLLSDLRSLGWIFYIGEQFDGRKRFMRTSFSQYNEVRNHIPGYRPELSTPEDPDQMRRDVKGIWIPREIWEIPGVNIYERVILYEIDSFDRGAGCCASDRWFSKRLAVKDTYVNKLVSRLKKKGLIYLVKFDGRTRWLRAVFSRHTPPGKRHMGLPNRGDENTIITQVSKDEGIDKMTPLSSLDQNESSDKMTWANRAKCHPSFDRNVTHSNTGEGNRLKDRNPPNPPSGGGTTRCAPLASLGTKTDSCVPEASSSTTPVPGGDSQGTSPDALAATHESYPPESGTANPTASERLSRTEKANRIRNRLHTDPEARFLNQLGLGRLEDTPDLTLIKYARYRAQGAWRDGDAERVYTVMFPRTPDENGKYAKNVFENHDLYEYHSALQERIPGYYRPPPITSLKEWVDRMVHTRGPRLSYIDYANQAICRATGKYPGPVGPDGFHAGADGYGNRWHRDNFLAMLKTDKDGKPCDLLATEPLSIFDAEQYHTGPGEDRVEAFLTYLYEDELERRDNTPAARLRSLQGLIAVALYRPDVPIKDVLALAYGQGLIALTYNPEINKQLVELLGARWTDMLQTNVEMHCAHAGIDVRTWDELARILRDQEEQGNRKAWERYHGSRVQVGSGDPKAAGRCQIYLDLFDIKVKTIGNGK